MQKTIEEKFRERERKLGFIAKGLVDVIWVLDMETMKYTYISPSVETIRGFTVEEVMGRPLREHLTAESYNKTVSVILESLREHETNADVKRAIEVEMYHKNGGTVWVEIMARLVKEPGGKIKAVGVARDISQRKFYEKEREKLIMELTAALEEQKRLREEIKVLRGLLPICAECKKIRDEQGDWWPVEEYIASRTEAHFTHTICPECKERTLAVIRGLI
ncbi:MAG: PAS domain-containing protein [Pseudomonadota bacterium]